MTYQLDPTTGRLRHLLTLEGLPVSLYEEFFAKAESFMKLGTAQVVRRPLLQGKLVINAFFEPSTRTRMSFEIAAKSLGAEVVNFDVQNSSLLAKGESFADTIHVLASLGANVIVIRHGGDLLAEVAGHDFAGVALVNGGDGCNSHPSQGLLDAWTVLRRRGAIAGLKVAIVGDIAHSRVARSLAHVYGALGAAEVRVSGPPELMPSHRELDHLGMVAMPDVDAALRDADVIVSLRVQYERLGEGEQPGLEDYATKYRIDARRLALAAPDALVMHPGPMNRGLEITSELADGPQSCFLEQVTNGVAMRMAIIQVLAGT